MVQSSTSRKETSKRESSRSITWPEFTLPAINLWNVWNMSDAMSDLQWEESQRVKINDGGSADYYKLPKEAKDLQDLIEFKKMNFACGNIFKAVYRLHDETHSNVVRDLHKIIWFANRELDRLTK